MNWDALPKPILETSRLRLRPMTKDDAPMIVRWRNSEHVASMSRESVQGALTVETHLDWFARTRCCRVDYIIDTRTDDKSIGSISLTLQKLSCCKISAELGKFIGAKSALGKGYAFEAVQRFLEYGFVVLDIDCVFALTRRTNFANIRINEKLGFHAVPLPVHLGLSTDNWTCMRMNRADYWRNFSEQEESTISNQNH